MPASKQKILLNIIKVLIAAAFFVLLMVNTSLIFPYVAGKAMAFRTIVSFTFIFYLILAWERLDYRPNFRNPLILSVTIFAASMVISALFGIDVIKSLWGDIERSEGVFQYLHYYIYFLMIASLFKERRDFELLMKVFLAVAVLISILGWMQYFGVPGFTLTGEKLTRIYSTLGNAIYLAAVMIFAIFSALYFLFRKYKNFSKIYRGLLICIILLFILTFFQSSTRGAALGLAVAFVVAAALFIFWLPKIYLKYKKLAVVLLVLGIMSIAGISYFRDSISFVKNNDLIYRLFDFSVIKNFSSVPRFWSWQAAWKGFMEKPILGWGSENYASIFNKYFSIKHYGGYSSETWFDRSHNMILDVLNSQGIVGLLAYFAILISAIHLIAKMVKRNPDKKFLGIWMIALLAAYFGQNMSVFDTLDTYILFYFFLGFIYAESQMPAAIEAKNKDSSVIARSLSQKDKNKNLKKETPFLPVFCFLLFIWFMVAWWGSYLPLKSNQTLAMVFRSINYNFDAGVDFYNQAIKMNSPFTLLDIQRRMIMPFVNVMQGNKVESSKMKPAMMAVMAEGERGLKVHPFDPQLYWLLADAYNRAGIQYNDARMILRAEEILKKGREINPRRPEYIFSLAQNYMIRGQYDDAAAVVKELIALAPDVSVPHFTLARIYVSAGNMDAALAEMDKALQFSHHLNVLSVAPGDIKIMTSIYRNAKQYDKIIKIYEDLLKVNPDNAGYMLELAKAYFDSANKEKAESIAQYALTVKDLDSDLKTEIFKFLDGLK